MAKIFLTTVLVVALAGVAKIEAQQGAANYGQDAANYAQQQGGLLSGLLGGGGSNSGPFEMIRQLPARGLQMLNNVLGGVTNMLPGFGRSANINQSQNNPLGQLNPNELLQSLPKNPVTDLAQGLLNQNGGGASTSNNGLLNLPNLNQITNPIMEPLQQGRLPDVNQVSRGATNTLRGVTDNLMRLPSNLGNTLNGAQGQQGLGGLLNMRPNAST